MELDLKEKTFLLPGGAKGIGRDIAFGSSGEGSNIALHYLNSTEEAIRTANRDQS